MIRTLAVLAGGFLGFAAALMIAMEPPGRVAGVGGEQAFETVAYQDRSTGEYEGELAAQPAPFNRGAVASRAFGDTAEGEVPRVLIQAREPDRTSDLYRLQFELARIDCFDGAIDGRWSLKFHDRLAHVALTQELDLETFVSVDQVLSALKGTSVGACSGGDAEQAARVTSSSTSESVVFADEDLRASSVEIPETLRARDADDRETPDQSGVVKPVKKPDEAISAYQQLDTFVRRDKGRITEGPVVETATAPDQTVSEPPARAYVAPTLGGRHAAAYPFREEKLVAAKAFDDTVADTDTVIATEVHVEPTMADDTTKIPEEQIGVEVHGPSLIVPTVGTEMQELARSESTFVVEERVVASLTPRVETASDVDDRPSVPVIVVVPRPAVAASADLVEALDATPSIPLPARRMVSFVRVFGKAAVVAASRSTPRVRRSPRRRKARLRARPKPPVKPKARRARKVLKTRKVSKITKTSRVSKATSKAPTKSKTWKQNRSAIFRVRD